MAGASQPDWGSSPPPSCPVSFLFPFLDDGRVSFLDDKDAVLALCASSVRRRSAWASSPSSPSPLFRASVFPPDRSRVLIFAFSDEAAALLGGVALPDGSPSHWAVGCRPSAAVLRSPVATRQRASSRAAVDSSHSEGAADPAAVSQARPASVPAGEGAAPVRSLEDDSDSSNQDSPELLPRPAPAVPHPPKPADAAAPQVAASASHSSVTSDENPDGDYPCECCSPPRVFRSAAAVLAHAAARRSASPARRPASDRPPVFSPLRPEAAADALESLCLAAEDAALERVPFTFLEPVMTEWPDAARFRQVRRVLDAALAFSADNAVPLPALRRAASALARGSAASSPAASRARSPLRRSPAPRRAPLYEGLFPSAGAPGTPAPVVTSAVPRPPRRAGAGPPDLSAFADERGNVNPADVVQAVPRGSVVALRVNDKLKRYVRLGDAPTLYQVSELGSSDGSYLLAAALTGAPCSIFDKWLRERWADAATVVPTAHPTGTKSMARGVLDHLAYYRDSRGSAPDRGIVIGQRDQLLAALTNLRRVVVELFGAANALLPGLDAVSSAAASYSLRDGVAPNDVAVVIDRAWAQWIVDANRSLLNARVGNRIAADWSPPSLKTLFDEQWLARAAERSARASASAITAKRVAGGARAASK